MSPMLNGTSEVRVLVVDDDSSSLSTIIPMLEFLKYEVGGVAKNSDEAMSILRLEDEPFDLVLSDVQIPITNAVQFRKQVEDEFKIPFIWMSTEESARVLLTNFEKESSLFIVKPPTAFDLNHLKQYALSRKKVRTLEEENCGSSKLQKRRLVWTRSLHNKFLKAVNTIGIDRSTPKKILEYMNVRRLTRANIASHLQKYRLYLRGRFCVPSRPAIKSQGSSSQSSSETPLCPTHANNSCLVNFANSKKQEGKLLTKSHQSFKTNNNNLRADTNDTPNMPLDPPLNNILESSGLNFQPNNIQVTSNHGNLSTNYGTNQEDLTTFEEQFFSNNPNNNGGLFGNDMNNDEFMGLLGEENYPQDDDMSCFLNDSDGFNGKGNIVHDNNDLTITEGMPSIDDQNALEDFFVEQGGIITTIMPRANEKIVEINNVVSHDEPNLEEFFATREWDDPALEMINFEVPNDSPTHFQDWASKNLAEIFPEGIDDLMHFL